jgi:choice-of-anchor A domain-containing protein
MKNLKVTYLSFVIPFLIIGCGQAQKASSPGPDQTSLNVLQSLEGEQGQECSGSATSVVALDRTHVHLSGNSYIEGSLTLSSGEASLKASGRALIDGNLVRAQESKTKFSGKATVAGTEMTGDYSALLLNAEQSSAQISAMAPTQSFERVKDSLEILGSGGVNVIHIDDVHLSGRDVLTLSGSASDVFIIDVLNDVKLSGKSSLLLNGVDPKKVLIHLSGENSRIHLSGNSEVFASVLTLRGDVHLSGRSVITGGVSAGGESIHISGRGQVLGDSNYCPSQPNPEPEPEPQPEPEPEPEPEKDCDSKEDHEPEPEPEPEPEEPGKPDNF